MDIGIAGPPAYLAFLVTVGVKRRFKHCSEPQGAHPGPLEASLKHKVHSCCIVSESRRDRKRQSLIINL